MRSPRAGVLLLVVAWNHKPARILSAFELNGVYRPRRTPTPSWLERLAGNIAPLRPGFSMVVAIGHEHGRVAPREGQPNSARVVRIQHIDDRRRIADPHARCRGVPLVLYEPHRSPGVSAVAAPLQHDVDVAMIAAAVFATFRECQQIAVLSAHDRRNAIRVIAILARLEHERVGFNL